MAIFFPTQKKSSDPQKQSDDRQKKKVRFFQGEIETYMHFKTFRFCFHAMVLRPGTEHQILTNV